MAIIRFKKLTTTAQLPTKGTPGSACFDFYVDRIERIGDNQAILYFGLACEFPNHYVMTLQPRSSFTLKGWTMANSPGQVDSDFRGELQIRVETFLQMKKEEIKPRKRKFFSSWFNDEPVERITITYPPLPFKEGDRCCQGRLERVEAVQFQEVEDLSTTVRGEGGHGSTGK